MKIRARFAALVVAAAAPLAIAGDDAPKYDIAPREVWTVGQVVTVTRHEAQDLGMTMDGKPMSAQHDGLDAKFVVRCDAVDADGKPTRRTVWFESWKQTRNGESDESISGAHVTVADGAWRLEAGRIASAAATKWLDKKYKKRSSGEGDADNPFKELSPPKMAVGEVWKPDPKFIGKAFTRGAANAPIDVSDATMEIKFAAVRGTSPDEIGDFEIKAHAGIAAKAAGLPAGAKIAPGSAVDLTGTYSAPLTRRTMLSTAHLSGTFAMDFEVEAQGRKVSLNGKGTMVQDESTVEGGEIPAPPKLASSDDPLPSPDKPATPPAPPAPSGK
jgi:hypothetical protein